MSETLSRLDPWTTVVDYKGSKPLCSKQDCGLRATRVGFASPNYRIMTCDKHEDELMELVKVAKASGPYTGSEPPLEYGLWARHHRSWYEGFDGLDPEKKLIIP